MVRLAVVLPVMLAVLCAGCAAQKTSFPPSEDTAKMLAEIEARGRDIQPVGADETRAEPPKKVASPVSHAFAACVTTGAYAAAACGYLALLFVYAVAEDGHYH